MCESKLFKTTSCPPKAIFYEILLEHLLKRIIPVPQFTRISFNQYLFYSENLSQFKRNV